MAASTCSGGRVVDEVVRCEQRAEYATSSKSRQPESVGKSSEDGALMPIGAHADQGGQRNDARALVDRARLTVRCLGVGQKMQYVQQAPEQIIETRGGGGRPATRQAAKRMDPPLETPQSYPASRPASLAPF